MTSSDSPSPSPDAALPVAPGADSSLRRYELACRCGAVVRGEFALHALPRRCPRCGEEWLVPIGGDGAFPPPIPSLAEKLTAAAERQESAEAAEPVRKPGRPLLTLPRVATLLVALLVVATVAWNWSLRRQAEARRLLEVAEKEGMSAFASGDYATARRLLSDALPALEGQRRYRLESTRLRQYAREAAIWSGRCPTELGELVAAMEEGEAAMQACFDRDFAGRHLIFQGRLKVLSPVSPQPGKVATSDQPDWEFDWLLVAGTQRIRLAIPAPTELDRLAQGEHEVLWGAELSRLVADERHPGGWKVELARSSVALLTFEPPLVANHWPNEPALAPLLQSQRKLLGIEP